MVRPLVYVLPALSGILLALSFPKPGLGFLAWAALVPLLLSIRGAGPGSSFRLGFAAGLVFYLISIYWVAGTMSRYGGLPYPVSLLLLLALSTYLALFFGAFGWLLSQSRGSWRMPLVAAAPIFWTALELARNYLLSGFPWNLLGYSQVGYPAVIQFADITGVYGISALIILVNTALAGLVDTLRRKSSPDRRAVAGAAFAALALVAAALYGWHRLSHPPAVAGNMKVALAQGNIDQFVKWDLAYQDETIEIYSGLTRGAAESVPDLIIWPETATPFYFQDDENREKVEKLASDTGNYILTGSPSFEKNKDGGFTDYNSAFLISPDGGIAGRYDKIHLVPFGEYVPLKTLLPFVSRMVTSIGDFGSGKEYTVIHSTKGSFGTAICFEAIFPELSRRFTFNGADFLVNLTNDAWFGTSAAPYQHFNMAVMRAVENRRTLVRAANTGISGVVTPMGMISARTDIFTRGYVIRDIDLVTEMSFYTRHGDVFAYACAGLSAIFLVLIIAGRRYNKNDHKATGGIQETK